MGEEYIRRTPPPDFPSQIHGCSSTLPTECPVRPVKGGRRRVSGCGKVFALPDPKWASTALKNGLLAIGLHKGWWSLDSPGTTCCG